MAAVRLSDIARDAGVSLATASRVLNGSSRVPGKAVAEKVRRSAEKLGYVTNAQAQALARSRSGLIGLVVHDIADPYFATLARAIQQRTFASDSQVLLTQTNRDLETETRAIRSLIAQRVDAIVLIGSHRYGADSDEVILGLLRGFERNGGHVIGLGQALGVGRTIVPDNAAASRELATALLAAGHRRFAVLEEVKGIPSAVDRTSGFRAALDDAGIAVELCAPAGLERTGGHTYAARIDEHLSGRGGHGDLPLCVFAPADVMAMGMLGELRRRGIDVPGRVAVAGFGGVPAADDTSPTLTTIALPLTDMAQQAVEWILPHGGDDAGTDDPGDDDPENERVRHVRGEVLLRESTRLGPGAALSR